MTCLRREILFQITDQALFFHVEFKSMLMVMAFASPVGSTAQVAVAACNHVLNVRT